jgi:hypothetical protein
LEVLLANGIKTRMISTEVGYPVYATFFVLLISNIYNRIEMRYLGLDVRLKYYIEGMPISGKAFEE